jgi:radical SAM protein with 4Fe4S-binding SPASM domain
MDKHTHIVKKRLDTLFMRKGGEAIPGTLDLELTERCNNDCVHCNINRPKCDHDAKRREITTLEVKAILEQAVALGFLSVRFTGGEPLLREDFEIIYEFARRQGLKVLIFTNATLITAHLAELLARLPPLERVEVSLYGMSEESYEAVSRTPGSWSAARQGVDRLLNNRVPFVVKSALLPPNKGEIEAFEGWARSLPWTDRPPSFAVFFDLRARRDSDAKNRLIRQLRPPAEDGVQFLARDRDAYIKDTRAFCTRFLGAGTDKLFPCGAGKGGCVDAYGVLQPCLLLRHPQTVYDLKRGNLRDAFLRFFPELREQRATNSDYLRRCARCFLRGLCEQCPARSWMEHGTLDTPVEYCCDVAHAQARLIGLLKEGEKAWEIQDWKMRLTGIEESRHDLSIA